MPLHADGARNVRLNASLNRVPDEALVNLAQPGAMHRSHPARSTKK